MKRVDKIKLWISLIFRIFLVAAAVIAIIKSDWMNLGLSLVTIFLTFLPAIIEKRFKVDFISEFEIVILFFIYASMYLGEIHSFYRRFWWWDIFLHALSGLIIGLIGFLLIYILNKEENVAIKLSPFFVAIFSLSFALAIGVIWEIFEFSMDSFFGFNMQKSGLLDTMWDLIVDAFSGLIVSVSGYFYLKKDTRFFDKLEKKIIKRN